MGASRRAFRRADRDAGRRHAAALHAIDCAIEAGLAIRAPGAGKLDILTPTTLTDEIRAPLVAALLAHKREVAAILQVADEGGGKAQRWVTPRRGRPS
jgi:hypothetical protein